MRKITIAVAFMMVLGLVAIAQAGQKIVLDSVQSQSDITELHMGNWGITPTSIHAELIRVNSNSNRVDRKRCDLFKSAKKNTYYVDLMASVVGLGAVGNTYIDMLEKGILGKCQLKYPEWAGTITDK